MAKNYRREFLEKLNGGVLYERDILNILLSNAYGGRDMSAVTDALLARFPSVRSIISADWRELTAVEGVTETVALYLRTLGLTAEAREKRDFYITSTQDCMELISSRFCGKDNESVEVYFVNKSGKVTDIKSFTSGNANRVEVSSAELMALLSSAKAYGIYFAHNHVNTSANPSHNDDFVTERVAEACKIIGLELFDHCIISSTGDTFSYSQSGKLEAIKSGLR